MIYFIEHDGMVKIGFSMNPNKLLDSLKTSNPGELIVRLIIEGDFDDEAKYHELFKEFHHRGEWYILSTPIKDFIEENQKRDLRYDFGLLNNFHEIRGETVRIRNMFGLRLREVGEKMGITAQSIKEIETRELTGTVSLNCLRKYAESLGYRLVYKFVKSDEDDESEVVDLKS
jgi:hypothetical protein